MIFNQRGQGVTEYALLLASVVLIGAVLSWNGYLGTAVQEKFEYVAAVINGSEVPGGDNGSDNSGNDNNPEGQDPASVAFDGMRKAKEEKVDLVICDTAGRLQNKLNLMNELSKMKRIISKEIEGAPHEIFLIIDATTGQNGVLQAKAFKECTSLTGVVITKMDGTSKGGIILAIRDELGIPVRFIGLGERMDDLQEFDLDQYLYGLCLGEED